MLKITIPASEFFNEETNEFVTVKECTLQLEHSLVSISKWESKWRKPFLTNGKKDDKTTAEIIDYIKCMTLTQNVKPEVYSQLTSKNIKDIIDYINAPMTATWFSEREDKKPGGRKRVITAELIYYWMIVCGIPFECQKWHLNRLLTLIRVYEEENKEGQTKKGPKNMRKLAQDRAALNKARRNKYHTRG